MKKILLIASSLFVATMGFAQQLLVHASGKDLYVEHKVVPKENFFSVGRLYSIAPKEIATYNNLDMTHGLTIGQVVKIPLTSTNFSQTADAGKPVYYVVGEKEGLYRVSLKNNNVLMANLRKWNHLANDNIKTGSKLIVGYVGSEAAPAVAATTTKEPATKTVVTEVPKSEPKQEEKRAEQKPTEPVAEKPIEKKTEAAKPQPIETKPVETKPTYTSTYTGGDSYFKKEYELQSRAHSAGKEQTATSSIFKTASGWQDGKYYAMIDGVEPGTIIKLSNPSNNKTVYAKVLSEMSGIRQNQGLDVRISNAAASALEVSDTEKFVVKVVY